MNKLTNLTKGAVISALYCVFILLYRFIDDVDLIFFLFPLPLLIYMIISDTKWVLMVEFSVLILSFFIIGNFYKWVSVIIGNIIIAFVFCMFENKIKNKMFGFVLLYIVCIVIDMYQTFFISYFVTNISFNEYINITVKEIVNMFPILNNYGIKKLILITLPVVFIIYSLIKILFNHILYMLIAVRIKIKDKNDFKFRIITSKFIPIVYLFSFIILIALANTILNNENIYVYIIFSLFLSIFIILSIYLIFLSVFYVRMIFMFENNIFMILITILMYIIAPISIIIGIFANYSLKISKNY